PGLAAERDRVAVPRQPVEIGTVKARESLQTIERAGSLERLGVKLKRRVRRVAARAAAGALLGALRVRRRIGAEEELPVATRGRPEQGEPMRLALEDRHAVEVRPDPADEQRIS